MKKIFNLYSRVGTSPYYYLKNYMQYINQYSINSRFDTYDNQYIIKDFKTNEDVFKCNSSSTFSQNINAWIDFGFIDYDKKNKIILKKVDQYENIESAIKKIKDNLLIESEDKSSEARKNSILIRLLILNKSIDKNTMNIFSFNKKNCLFDFDKIVKDISEIEHLIAQDDKFMNTVNKLEFEIIDKGDENE